MADALARWPETLRQSLVLIAEVERPRPEIAAELPWTTEVVELRLYHARKRLHILFQKG